MILGSYSNNKILENTIIGLNMDYEIRVYLVAASSRSGPGPGSPEATPMKIIEKFIKKNCVMFEGSLDLSTEFRFYIFNKNRKQNFL